ncbi:MAG: glycosyl hydrolase family 65 protein [Lachnospiraceae bacterium]|nr:glycosyl hydrolase family 65 protein [Lachnospiraceae bacterium]
MNWTIRTEGFDRDQIPAMENRFFCGNGYLGIRGAPEEFGKEEMPAVNLAGIFDKTGEGWREPLNAPNGLYTFLRVDGEEYGLPEQEPLQHELELDYRHGILYRKTSWKTRRGIVTVRSERFAGKKDVHLIAMRYAVSADFHGEIELCEGIDGDVWDIHGPHYDQICSESISMEKEELQNRSDGWRWEKDCLRLEGITHEKKDAAAVAECIGRDFPCDVKVMRKEKQILRCFSFVSEIGREYSLEKGIAVYTSRDVETMPEDPALWGKSSRRAEKISELLRSKEVQTLLQFMKNGYEEEKKLQIQAWEEKWSMSQVEIEGDDSAMEALNYSIYHLMSIAPAPGSNLSIPARGLSGQTYKGAVFWDTEMFMLDFFLFTDPDVARSLVKYRVDTLAGAQKKAADYGYEGAFYAWESQEGGFDACTDYNVTDVFTGRPMRTYFKDKQYHISAAAAYGILRYLAVTGDESLLAQGGLETVVECARFYYSLLVKRAVSEVYEIHDVIGPDEYHERVNNNAYTNRMAKFVLESAAGLLEEFVRRGEMHLKMNESPAKESSAIEPPAQEQTAEPPVQDPEWQNDPKQAERLAEQFREAAEKLYIPEPDAAGIIPQFDGYEKLEDASLEQVRSRLLNPREYWGGAYGVASETKVIKQADVVTMLNLFPNEYSDEIKKKNWEYYEPRTEHGSSLSSCMYAMLACKCGMAEKACPFFEKSARADLDGGGKEWAGLVYIGGTHPAAAGGAYMTAVEGFGGISIQNGKLQVNSCLPEKWKRLKFCVCCRGIGYRVEIKRENDEIKTEIQKI